MGLLARLVGLTIGVIYSDASFSRICIDIYTSIESMFVSLPIGILQTDFVYHT